MMSNHGRATASIRVPSFVRAPGTTTVCKSRLGMVAASTSGSGGPNIPVVDDDVHAARLYGNLVCRVGIIRPERWWCFPEPVADDRFSRTYVLQSRISLSFI